MNACVYSFIPKVITANNYHALEKTKEYWMQKCVKPCLIKVKQTCKCANIPSSYLISFNTVFSN